MSATNPAAAQRTVYSGYQGKPNPDERERIVHLLDTYSTTEGFVAQYLPKWIAVSPNEAVQGGLRTVQAREAAHARLMKKRLKELGETSTASIPEERRAREIPFFASSEHTDVQKLKVLVDLFGDAEEFLRPVTEIMNSITVDPHTRELLRTILDDERQSVAWIQHMHRVLAS